MRKLSLDVLTSILKECDSKIQNGTANEVYAEAADVLSEIILEAVEDSSTDTLSSTHS